MLLAGLAGLFLLPEPWNVLAVCAAAVVEVAEVAFWIRFLRRYRVRTGAEGMIGERGEVIEAVAPAGARQGLRRDLGRPRRGAPLGPGEPVRVAAVDGLTLEVEADARNGKGPLKRGPVSERTCRRRIPIASPSVLQVS